MRRRVPPWVAFYGAYTGCAWGLAAYAYWMGAGWRGALLERWFGAVLVLIVATGAGLIAGRLVRIWYVAGWDVGVRDGVDAVRRGDGETLDTIRVRWAAQGREHPEPWELRPYGEPMDPPTSGV